MQRNFEAERLEWLNDKKTLEGTIFDLSSSEKHSESDRNAWEAETRQLEERAKVRHSRYLFFFFPGLNSV